MAFGSMAPNVGSQGLALLRQIQDMNGGTAPGAAPGAAPAPAAFEGAPDFINRGFIGKAMSGNPGGLIGAIMKRQGMPVDPGAPPPAGDPAYFPGGQGPMAGGPAPGTGGGFLNMGGGGGLGMLAKLFSGGG